MTVPLNMTYKEWQNQLIHSDAMLRMSRKDKNTGEFSSYPELMQKRHVLQVAREYGIDTRGITFKIQRGQHLIGKGYQGRADGKQVGRIDLLPDAFKSREDLIRVIYHETIHVEQYKQYGAEYVQNNRKYFETEAERLENEFIEKLRKEGKL